MIPRARVAQSLGANQLRTCAICDGAGRHVSRDIDTGRVTFCGTENISTPNLSYAAQYLACALPCERFTSALADTRASLGAGAVRYSFTATDFHRLPFAGLPAHPSTASIPDLRVGTAWPETGPVTPNSGAQIVKMLAEVRTVTIGIGTIGTSAYALICEWRRRYRSRWSLHRTPSTSATTWALLRIWIPKSQSRFGGSRN